MKELTTFAYENDDGHIIERNYPVFRTEEGIAPLSLQDLYPDKSGKAVMFLKSIVNFLPGINKEDALADHSRVVGLDCMCDVIMTEEGPQALICRQDCDLYDLDDPESYKF